ncbi:MAG TPA: hypothetical protein PLU50_12670, partial [Pseudobdellovibrionaceae bacterium]|nr:hypothetical protein [Pseudobdellovibrionaceae bacterium]
MKMMPVHFRFLASLSIATKLIAVTFLLTLVVSARAAEPVADSKSASVEFKNDQARGQLQVLIGGQEALV